MDLITAIQKQVDEIADKHYKEEEEWCTPRFTVSLLQNNKIVLTCKHRDLSFSEIIFPVAFEDKEEWAYGLCPLEDYMKSLYNRTM